MKDFETGSKIQLNYQSETLNSDKASSFEKSKEKYGARVPCYVNPTVDAIVKFKTSLLKTDQAHI